MSDFSQRLFRWSERLRAIAQTGLAFDPHAYDAERYEAALALAAEIRAVAVEGRTEELSETWLAEVRKGIAGYVTPQISVVAAVLNEDGELLLLRRSDSGKWFPPAGWADVGLAGAEVAAKEVCEETGYHVRPVALVGCCDSLVRSVSPVHFYCVFYGCEPAGGELRRNEVEALEIGWFPKDRLPGPLHVGDWWVEPAFGWREPGFRPLFDTVDEFRLRELWK